MNSVLMIPQKVRVKKRYSFFYGIESVPFLNCFAISGFVTKIAVSASLLTGNDLSTVDTLWPSGAPL